MKHHYEDESTKIIVYFPRTHQERLLANATISIRTIQYGFVTLKGFQIWKSNMNNRRLMEAINITPPTKQCSGRYIRQVFLEESKSWYELERLIYSAYCQAYQDQEGKDKKEDSEQVKPEEIPF